MGLGRQELFDEARAVLAGGVNSPVRAWKILAQPPLFITRGAGAYIWDTDGRQYVDCCMSWGALILGHAAPCVVEAVCSAARDGTSFGAPTVHETELARLICAAIPSMERVRFVNSGTEAVMSALRLARGYTGRPGVLKFDGCYHGHVDALLVKAGSGTAALPHASSAGVPPEMVRHTYSVPFNDIRAVRAAIAAHAEELAAVIVEPVPANMGLVLPEEGFLHELRELTHQHGILLIFDEVISGFRLCYGGAQTLYGVTPDLTTLGKIIGGGLPCGAFGGRADIMAHLAPEGNVYQAGTLSGNPLAMRAGCAVLATLRDNPRVYTEMAECVAALAEQWRAQASWPIVTLGSMFTIFFRDTAPRNFAEACVQDVQAFRVQYARWLAAGVYYPPALCETAFVSTAHTFNDVARLVTYR